MPPQNKTTSPTIISDKVEGAVPGASLIKQSMLDAKLKLTAQLCSEAEPNDDTTRASHKEDTEYARQNGKNPGVWRTYRPAKSNLRTNVFHDASLERARSTWRRDTNRTDHISGETNRKVEIN